MCLTQTCDLYWSLGLHEMQRWLREGYLVGKEADLWRELLSVDLGFLSISLRAPEPYVSPVASGAQTNLPLAKPHNGESHRCHVWGSTS